MASHYATRAPPVGTIRQRWYSDEFEILWSLRCPWRWRRESLARVPTSPPRGVSQISHADPSFMLFCYFVLYIRFSLAGSACYKRILQIFSVILLFLSLLLLLPVVRGV